jgi:hypothetical protein
MSIGRREDGVKRLSYLLGGMTMLLAGTPLTAQRASIRGASPRQSFEFSRDWRMQRGDDPEYSDSGTNDAALAAGNTASRLQRGAGIRG